MEVTMDWINSILESILDAMTDTFLTMEVWRIIVAGVILIVTFATRKIFVNFLIMILKKITAKTKTELDDELVDAVDPPARLIVVTIGLYFAIRTLGFIIRDDSFS